MVKMPKFTECQIVISILLAVFLALLVVTFLDKDRTSMLWRGDYPGIYVPARLFISGDIEHFYDQQTQQQLENRFWPSLAGNYYISSYPPNSVIFTAPFAYLTPLLSKWLWTGAMFLLLVLCVFGYLPRFLGDLTLNHKILICLMPPLLLGVLSGQNNALSLFLFLSALTLLAGNTRQHSFFAGCLLALWLFKPQYPLFFVLLAVMQKRICLLSGFASGAALIYLFNSYYFGEFWLENWLQSSRVFTELNYHVNGYQMVSLAAVCFRLFLLLGIESVTAYKISLGLSAILSIIFLLFLSKFKSKDSFSYLALVVPMLAPQTLFYDISLAIIGLVLLAKGEKRRAALWIIFFVWFFCEFFRGCSLFPGYFFGNLAIFICAYQFTQKQRET
ncbi:MAG: DUF2029 domain-containing protein [Deltaproteobacteria bacterium]|nr:DUF2029 domain-containing protein [Deltaproteobacteria bacterium]